MQAVALSASSSWNPISKSMHSRYVNLVTFLFFFCTQLAFADVDTVASTNDTGMETETHTLSITIGSNQNRLLLVSTACEASAIDPTNVDFNTTESLTELIDVTAGTGIYNSVSLWYRIAPSTGTHDILVTSAQARRCVVGAYSLYNIDQSTPFRDMDSVTASTGTSASITLTSVSGDLTILSTVAGSVANELRVNTMVPGGSATEQWELDLYNAAAGMDGQWNSSNTLVATGTSTTVSTSWTNSTYHSAVAVDIIPASAALSSKKIFRPIVIR